MMDGIDYEKLVLLNEIIVSLSMTSSKASVVHFSFHVHFLVANQLKKLSFICRFVFKWCTPTKAMFKGCSSLESMP